jgi:hypothetical protein
MNEMSYFLFGTFNTLYDKKLFQQVKTYGQEKDIYVWFNEEITFYNDIQRMLEEQNSNGNIKFAITSINQPCNSSDVLFPFDKFTNEVLFADESRSFFRKCCRENLEILFSFLKKMIEVLYIKQEEIFIVGGYDDIFQKKMCSIDEMKKDILLQVEEKVFIDSCIYYVH